MLASFFALMCRDIIHSAYVVLSIRTGLMIYAGPSDDHAAMALEPGTTYGTGFSFEQAMREATWRREWHEEVAA